jgi:ferredoxin
LYGIIPLGHRSKYHSEYAGNEYFSQVLTDIFSIAMPQLTIVDGIIAMEGEGPAAGSLRKLGIILASQDTVAVDAVATNIMGLNPTDIYTTLYSDERGLGEGTLENIEIVGEELEGVVVPDFKPPSSAVNTLSRRLDKALPKFIIRQLSLKPNVITSLCTGCSECEKICPVGAAKVSGKKAQINHSICVQCMCCHEVCRFNAIQLKRSVTGTLINFVIKMAKRLLLSKG